MNKLGSALYRVTNIGFLTLANLLVSLVMTEEEFGAFYTVMAGIALTISLFDVFNAKYMVNIFGQDPDRWPGIFPTRLLSSLACGLTASGAMAFFGYGVETVISIGLFAALMLFNSGLLTLFYCRANDQSTIFWSTLVGTLTVAVLALPFVQMPLTLSEALLVLTGYKAVETAYLMVKLRPGGRIFVITVASVRGAFATFPRLAFYLQNILSVMNGRLHAFLLPVWLTGQEFGLVGQAATLLSIYVFLMIYLGTDFFRRASGVGLENVDWRRHVWLIALSLVCFCGFLFIVVPWVYPNLTPYLMLMMGLAIMVSFSSQQGYLLFLFGLDRWIIYLSLGTPLVSLLAFTLLAGWLDLVGALIAMILVDLLSVLTVLIILRLHFRSAATLSGNASQ